MGHQFLIWLTGLKKILESEENIQSIGILAKNDILANSMLCNFVTFEG
jgi:hypothetical protein